MHKYPIILWHQKPQNGDDFKGQSIYHLGTWTLMGVARPYRNWPTCSQKVLLGPIGPESKIFGLPRVHWFLVGAPPNKTQKLKNPQNTSYFHLANTSRALKYIALRVHVPTMITSLSDADLHFHPRGSINTTIME